MSDSLVSDSRVVRGAVLLAVLSVADIVGSLLLPAPPDAPAGASLIGVVLGVISLVGLAIWWSRRRSGGGRAAMWVAVVPRVVSALLPVLGLAEMEIWMILVTVAFLLLTVVGIVLVRPALGRRAAVAA